MEIQHLIVGDLVTNCYIIADKGEVAIIDPGGEPEKILETAQKMGNVKYIINTHYHPDHVLGNEFLRKNFNAQILVHQEEKDYLRFTPDRFLADGEKIRIGGIELEVILTPGHSRGSICLLAPNSIFTGDLLFVDGYGRTDLPGGSEEEIKKSLEKISGIIKPGMTVYPGHGEIFFTEKK